MRSDKSPPKTEKPDAPPPYTGTGSLDFTGMSSAPPPKADTTPVVARPRKKTASLARKEPGLFPGRAGSVLAVIAIAVAVAFAIAMRSSETPVTPPPAPARGASGMQMPATPQSSPAPVPPPAAAAPQPAQKPAWPPDFLAAFKEYTGKPGSKAMAMALDREGKMAYIGVFERATQSEANDEALSQCARFKTQSGVQENCRLYAVGDEVVW